MTTADLDCLENSFKEKIEEEKEMDKAETKYKIVSFSTIPRVNPIKIDIIFNSLEEAKEHLNKWVPRFYGKSRCSTYFWKESVLTYKYQPDNDYDRKYAGYVEFKIVPVKEEKKEETKMSTSIVKKEKEKTICNENNRIVLQLIATEYYKQLQANPYKAKPKILEYPKNAGSVVMGLIDDFNKEIDDNNATNKLAYENGIFLKIVENLYVFEDIVSSVLGNKYQVDESRLFIVQLEDVLYNS